MVHIDNKEYKKNQNNRRRLQLSERKLLENTLIPFHEIPDERFICRDECNVFIFDNLVDVKRKRDPESLGLNKKMQVNITP